MNYTLDPAELSQTASGRRSVAIVVRDDAGKPLFSDTVFIESDGSRTKFARRVAKLVNTTPAEIELKLLALIDAKPPATEPAPKADNPAALLASMPQDVRDAAEQMLKSPDLIDSLHADFAATGIAGGGRVALAAYITGVSRQLPRCLALIVQGATASGKSYELSVAASFFPAETKIEAHHLTPAALYYLPDDALIHKFVVAGERSKDQSDEQSDTTKALREMISDGKLTAVVTEKIDGRMQTARYEKPGPIAFAESTSATTIFAEDLNRCIVVPVDESIAQTRRIVSRAATEAAGTENTGREFIVAKHHAMQRMLKPYRVRVPFAQALAEKFPVEQVEARRAMPHLLRTIQAVALLRQYQRNVEGDCIVATADDYAVALGILGPTLNRLVGGIGAQVERVLDAIQEKSGGDTFTRHTAATWAGIKVSDAGGRIRALVESEHLIEERPHHGATPALYRLAPNQPPDTPAGLTLPTPADLAAASTQNTSLVFPGNTDRHTKSPEKSERLLCPEGVGPTNGHNLSNFVAPEGPGHNKPTVKPTESAVGPENPEPYTDAFVEGGQQAKVAAYAPGLTADQRETADLIGFDPPPPRWRGAPAREGAA